MPRTLLPTREWIAKVTPENTLEEVSPEEIQRARLVWNDEFDNVLDLSHVSENPGLSRKQLCQLQKNALHHNGSDHSYGGLSQRNMLLTDGCFVDGLVEGFDAVLTIAFMLGLVAIAVMAIHIRLKAWRYKRLGHLAVGSHFSETDMKNEV
ncbi:hypothetical protein Q7P37_002461 [Cladosporium fusiforme]